MTDIDIEDLKATAKAATAGPWSVDGPLWNQIVWSSAENRVCFLAHSSGLDDGRDAATGAFIASANPSAVLALIARVERAEALADLLEGAQEENSRLRALLARAGEALRPFSKECELRLGWAVPSYGSLIGESCLTYHDLLDARTVVAEIEKEIGK